MREESREFHVDPVDGRPFPVSYDGRRDSNTPLAVQFYTRERPVACHAGNLTLERLIMNRKSMSLAGLLASGILVSALQAQPPEPGERGPDRRGPRPGGPTFMMMNPLAAAIDADKNNEISAEELKNAANALETLDKNDDGKLTFDELRPSFSRDSDRPGFGPRRDRGPDADVADRPRGERRFEFRGRERDGRERGLRPERPDGFRPTPEAFVKRAMTFDADQDGKLSREELAKFAEQIVNRSRDARPGDRPGPRGNRDGDRPDRERPDRGERETRPEAE